MPETPPVPIPQPTPDSPVLVRGPLRYVVETSSPQLEAGKRFSVSVRTTNPYDVPVMIRDVQTKLPAKFITPPANEPRGFWTRLNPFRRVFLDINSVAFTRATRPEGTQEDSGVLLQPGNSTVNIFLIRTSNATLFVPSLYNLNFLIEYQIDGKTNHDTVAYQMNVRAPLGAIIFGSIVGSLIGYIVKEFTDKGQFKATQFWIGLAKAVLISGIVVVAFARKKDAQPVLSIEDFWGGLFVGFLSAYGGDALLRQFTGGSAPSAPSPKP